MNAKQLKQLGEKLEAARQIQRQIEECDSALKTLAKLKTDGEDPQRLEIRVAKGPFGYSSSGDDVVKNALAAAITLELQVTLTAMIRAQQRALEKQFADL